jgi:hypothetical protein
VYVRVFPFVPIFANDEKLILIVRSLDHVRLEKNTVEMSKGKKLLIQFGSFELSASDTTARGGITTKYTKTKKKVNLSLFSSILFVSGHEREGEIYETQTTPLSACS